MAGIRWQIWERSELIVMRAARGGKKYFKKLSRMFHTPCLAYERRRRRRQERKREREKEKKKKKNREKKKRLLSEHTGNANQNSTSHKNQPNLGTKPFKYQSSEKRITWASIFNCGGAKASLSSPKGRIIPGETERVFSERGSANCCKEKVSFPVPA